MVPCTLTTEIEREGRRILLIDVILTQEGERVARGTATSSSPRRRRTARCGAPSRAPLTPPLDVVPPTTQARGAVVRSTDTWSQNFLEHQNADRKTSWSTAVPVVTDEPLTGFRP